MSRKLSINHKPMQVHSESKAMHGFTKLVVGDAGPNSVPSAEHSVPTSWWNSPTDSVAVYAGGCRYEKLS
jgi:hypothetical protein